MTGSPVLEALEIENSLDLMCRPHGWEWALDADTGTDCAWAVSLRVTLNPNDPDGPDRSLVTYAVGAADPAEGAARARTAMVAWLRELGLLTADTVPADGGRS